MNLHRNTATVLSGLAVVAALLLGLNIGRRLPDFARNPQTIVQASPTPTPTENPSIARGNALGTTTQTEPYTNTACGYTVNFPVDWQVNNLSESVTTFTPRQSDTEGVSTICQADIPRPPVEPKLVKSTTLGGVPAELYHDTDAEDGTALSVVYARVPNTDLDILVSGTGAVFDQIVASFAFTQPTPTPTATPTPAAPASGATPSASFTPDG